MLEMFSLLSCICEKCFKKWIGGRGGGEGWVAADAVQTLFEA